MWRKGNLLALFGVVKWLQPLWKTVWWFLKKLKIELPQDPAISLLSIYLKKTKTNSKIYICISAFTAALFTITKTWKQPKCPLMIDEGIKKMEYYSAIKNKILPFVTTWMDLESIMLGEVS